ncbi:MAG: nucleotidyltransferase domain-containing protein, partial [Candidatus Omnitrophica bacterium]|nr:nucleotidyltransferase domain-containing protein [Candidatus Omnitrophota bacterium]
MEDKIIKNFIYKLEQVLGEKLKSCVLYGSYLKGTYKKGVSDINLLVIVDSLEYKDLRDIEKKISKYAYKNFLNVFFFPEWFFLKSSDVFPVEWQDIKENSLVIYGNDYIKKIEINKEHLRIELERKIKQLFLDFQQGIIFEKDKYYLINETIKNLKFLLQLVEKQMMKKLILPDFLKQERKIKKVEFSVLIDEILKFFSQIIFLIDEDF